MIAIDTNVVVRLIAQDDPDQLAVAEHLIQSGRVFVPLLAIVEAEWVLRSRHGLARADVFSALRNLLLMETVEVELEDLALWALDQFQAGADLADMALLVAARDCDSFATFDRRLPREAGLASPVRVEVLA